MSAVAVVDAEHPDESLVQRAAEVVCSGGLIVYPTETLYGIGADATNPLAIRRVAGAKRRSESKPILVIVNSYEMLKPFVDTIPISAELLMEKFWPGPLTLVFKASRLVPDEISVGTGTIGMRIPSNKLCMMLVAAAGVPLTSTSANIVGEKPARTIQMIRKSLAGIDLYLDAGEIPESLPSTVVDVSTGVPRVLRHGAIANEKIQQVLPGILF